MSEQSLKTMKKKKYEAPKTEIFTNSAYILQNVVIKDSFDDEVIIEFGKENANDDWWNENGEDNKTGTDKFPHQKNPWED